MIGPYPLGPMSNPCVPNSIHATKPFAQLPLPLGVPQKNLSPYSRKPLSVRCLHMPLLDGSHSFVTLQPITWKFYTELHAGSLLVASFPPLLTTPSRGPTPSSKADSRASDPLLLWTCSAPSPRLLQPLCPGN